MRSLLLHRHDLPILCGLHSAHECRFNFVRFRIPELYRSDAKVALQETILKVTDDSERGAIIEGRHAYERGEFKSLDQWRHEMGIGGH
jgi:hypothetical protein